MEIIKEKYCINCKRMLPESFFYKLKILKLNSYCKECCRQSILEKQHNFKTECVTYKGNHCCECGYNRCVSALEFHHINPNEKEIMFSHSNITVFDEYIKRELDKCILVCVNCHRLIHSTDTTINYLNTTEEDKRYCSNCKQDLPLSYFYQISGRDGYSPYCKECERIKVVERQQRFKKQCVEYKNGKCYFCEYNLYLGALEFHHINQDEKKFNISSKRRVVLSDEVKDELDKCILVCGNCHREIHAGLINMEQLIRLP